MSIFTKISAYFTGRRLTRLERDLIMLEHRVKFEPKYSKITKDLFTDDKFTRRMTEYMVWHTGDVDVIRDFFVNEGHLPAQSGASSPDSNLFWETAPDDYRFIHSGIPALISTKNAAILFGKGFTFDLTVTNEDGSENKKAGADAKEKADKLIAEMNTDRACVEAADMASWGGHVFLKLSYDADLSPHPILEAVDIRNGEEIKKRGITQALVFKSWINHRISDSKTVKYRLDEIYRTITKNDISGELEDGEERVKGEIGDAVIEYELYQMQENGKEIEVPFNSIEETEGIPKRIQAFPGVKGILAVGVPNKLPNNDFIDCPYGASDYAHSTTAFDSLDEVMSELARETRDNKTIRFWPSDLLDKDTSGNIVGVKNYIRNAIQYERDLSEKAENKVETQSIDDKTTSLMEKLRHSISIACNNAGLSPLALGITGLESVSAGEQSQRERNKVTLETRNLKIKLWEPALEYIIKQSIKLDGWLHGGTVDGFEREERIDLTNARVSVHFPDYIVSSDTENITTWGQGVQMGVVDRKTAIDRIFPDLDESKRLEMYTLLSYEKGVASDNPNALSMANLLGVQPQSPTQ